MAAPSDVTKPNLIFIFGPTASGKSDFAVEAAEALRPRLGFLPEIINGDSIQFYQEVDIGAAKPGEELMQRVPHHLVSWVAPPKTVTAGDFRRAALPAIEEACARGVTTLFCVGGSGFYLQALEKGMYPVPEVPLAIRQGVEADLLELGGEALHRELRRRDPEAGAKIKPADHYRISRALEVLRTSEKDEREGGRPSETLSQMKARFESEKEESPFRSLKFGIACDRIDLRSRVERRARWMLHAGLIDEVENLRARALGEWSPLQSVGYKEVQEFLDGRLARTDLETAIVTSTMQLAKRQMTWFKRDPETLWLPALPLAQAEEIEAGAPIAMAPDTPVVAEARLRAFVERFVQEEAATSMHR